MDDDDLYNDEGDISNADFFQLDAEYDVLLEIKQHKNAIWDNNDKDNVDVGESDDSVDADAEADDDHDDDDDDEEEEEEEEEEDNGDEKNNYEKQEESNDTQQYSKRTREQVINDRYILKQYKTRQSENSILSGIQINKCTSVWKESEEEKRQRIELLLFPKQQ